MLFIGMAVVLAACGGEGQELRSSKADCFTATPQVQPTRAELEGYARIKLPPSATGLEVHCDGFMDRRVRARFTIARRDLRRFIHTANFRGALVKGERPFHDGEVKELGWRVDAIDRVLGLNEEAVDPVVRHIIVDLDRPDNPVVYLQAFG